jgi:hypothetical protein
VPGGGVLPSFDFLDDDPHSVDCLIQYLYRQDYQNTHPGHDDNQRDRDNIIKNLEEIRLSDYYTDDSYLDFHVKMHALAEKYDILAPKGLALGKFNNAIQRSPPLDRFLNSAEEAYTSTIPENRNARRYC